MCLSIKRIRQKCLRNASRSLSLNLKSRLYEKKKSNRFYKAHNWNLFRKIGNSQKGNFRLFFIVYIHFTFRPIERSFNLVRFDENVLLIFLVSLLERRGLFEAEKINKTDKQEINECIWIRTIYMRKLLKKLLLNPEVFHFN